MNYKQFGKDLLCQKAKGCQWYRVPEEELVRLALLGVEHERQLTQRAADGLESRHLTQPTELSLADKDSSPSSARR